LVIATDIPLAMNRWRLWTHNEGTRRLTRSPRRVPVIVRFGTGPAATHPRSDAES
jgi:hypothetical protein